MHIFIRFIIFVLFISNMFAYFDLIGYNYVICFQKGIPIWIFTLFANTTI